MTRAFVRSTIAAFIDPLAYTGGPNVICTSTPKILSGERRTELLDPGVETNCAAVIHIVGETEDRIGVGGPHAGKKQVTYDIVLQLYCHSTQLKGEDAMDDFDVIVDALKDRLRSDHTLGTDPSGSASQDGPTRIFQAAEPKIEGDYSDPVVTGKGAIELWGAVRFDVSQILNS